MVQINLEDAGIERIRIYADSSRERNQGLRTLLDITDELESIERKLRFQTAARALDRGEK